MLAIRIVSFASLWPVQYDPSVRERHISSRRVAGLQSERERFDRNKRNVVRWNSIDRSRLRGRSETIFGITFEKRESFRRSVSCQGLRGHTSATQNASIRAYFFYVEKSIIGYGSGRTHECRTLIRTSSNVVDAPKLNSYRFKRERQPRVTWRFYIRTATRTRVLIFF